METNIYYPKLRLGKREIDLFPYWIVLLILDLITGDSTQSDWQINDRKGAMKRKHLIGYQQIQQSSASIRDTSINRRIRGWLKSNAAGTELP